jgi:hypothetical protein
MRTLSAVSVAALLCAAAPAFADAAASVAAAKKAEKRGEWKKALSDWKAAYAADVNAEYLIGIGDCYAHLGNNEEARNNYNAYLADPLALPANVEKVKAKIAGLDAPGGLALPGGGLALPGSDAPPPLPGAAPGLPGLELPGASPAVATRGKKSRKSAEPPPALPGLDLPGAAPAPATAQSDPGLGLPGLDLPGAAPAPKKETKVASAAPPGLPGLDLPGASTPAPKKETKVASASPGLDLPGLPGATPAPAATPAPKPAAVASTAPAPSKEPGKQVAMATPAKKPVPEAVIARPPPAPIASADSGGGGKILAYVAGGAAVVGLGVGGFGFLQASSAHSDLTSKIHDGATAQSLLDKEKSNKTLSLIGVASGVLLGGAAAALFAF